MKNGDSITPQITSADCPSAKVINAIELPPTMRARRRSPRRQTVIVASTKKTRSNSTLSWPIKVQGFGTPTGAERSEEHTSELQSLTNLVCRLLLEKKKK